MTDVHGFVPRSLPREDASIMPYCELLEIPVGSDACNQWLNNTFRHCKKCLQSAIVAFGCQSRNQRCFQCVIRCERTVSKLSLFLTVMQLVASATRRSKEAGSLEQDFALVRAFCWPEVINRLCGTVGSQCSRTAVPTRRSN